jgi:hypothetical protein
MGGPAGQFRVKELHSCEDTPRQRRGDPPLTARGRVGQPVPAFTAATTRAPDERSAFAVRRT